MLMNMLLKEAQGFTKEEAFATTGIDADFSMFKNATQAWKKAGSPLGKELGKFLAGYSAKQKLIGAYIVVDSSSADTRERPYKIVNEITDGKRKFKRSYAIVEAELKVSTTKIADEEGNEKEITNVKVISTGATEGKADKKETAMQLMRDIIAETKKDYVIKIVEEVVEGKEFAGYGIYTPSKSAKTGKFVFFTQE